MEFPTTRRASQQQRPLARARTRCKLRGGWVCSHASAATSLQSNGRDRRGQHAWPFRLVRVDDDGHGGRQGLLRRRRGLGHAGRVDAGHGLHVFYRREGLGQRVDHPVGGREEIGHAAELARICRCRRRGRRRRPHQAPWRHRVRPTDGHHQYQPRFGRRRSANGIDRAAQMADTRPGATGGAERTGPRRLARAAGRRLGEGVCFLRRHLWLAKSGRRCRSGGHIPTVLRRRRDDRRHVHQACRWCRSPTGSTTSTSATSTRR